MDTKQKYIRLKRFGSIIIFPAAIEHSEFRHMDVISAGFCYVNAHKERVDCFGESVGLELKANVKDDTMQATKQIFGIDACLKLVKE